MKLYKVVRVENGKRVSAMVRGKAQVTYHRDSFSYPPKWLKDKGYGICVFSRLDAAREFARIHSYGPDFEVWEVEVLPHAQKKVYGFNHRPADTSKLSMGFLDTRVTSNFPLFTRMVSSVRLKRKVAEYARGKLRDNWFL